MGNDKTASQPDERAACVHADEPKACYRVRCQLGNKCVDDEMSPRATAPLATVKGDETAGFEAWAARRFPAKCLSTRSDSREMDEAREFAREGWEAHAAVPQAGAPNDAAITACALMIKGICMTLPQDQWSRKIEERIRFMLATPQAEK